MARERPRVVREGDTREVVREVAARREERRPPILVAAIAGDGGAALQRRVDLDVVSWRELKLEGGAELIEVL